MQVMSDNGEAAEEVLKQRISDRADRVASETAKTVRENAIDNLSENKQGESGIIEYVTEVQQSRNEQGEFTSAFEFEVRHPTAKLHERGGEIEPTYSRAMTEGWDRDGFYEGLTDCNYVVRKKRFMRQAVRDAMREAED